MASYDLIISEPSNPWVAGVGSLFTREFFEAARDRLAPGGALVQWFHIYDMDDAMVRLILPSAPDLPNRNLHHADPASHRPFASGL